MKDSLKKVLKKCPFVRWAKHESPERGANILCFKHRRRKGKGNRTDAVPGGVKGDTAIRRRKSSVSKLGVL